MRTRQVFGVRVCMTVYCSRGAMPGLPMHGAPHLMHAWMHVAKVVLDEPRHLRCCIILRRGQMYF